MVGQVLEVYQGNLLDRTGTLIIADVLTGRKLMGVTQCDNLLDIGGYSRHGSICYRCKASHSIAWKSIS